MNNGVFDTLFPFCKIYHSKLEVSINEEVELERYVCILTDANRDDRVNPVN